MKLAFSFSLCLLFASATFAQKDYCTEVLKVLNEQEREVCDKTPAEENCNVFVAKALKQIWGINDFIVNNIGDYYKANKIVEMLFTDLKDNWRILGTADNQQVLDSAQIWANSNYCVIAVWRNPSKDKKAHGHVALVLPGKQLPGWNGHNVPNAANFTMGDSSMNFVCKRLSGAFGYDKIKQTLLLVYTKGS